MARILCITDGARFRLENRIPGNQTTPVPNSSWDKLATVISSPVVVTSLFVLLLLICVTSY
jgi:hypothetical protein